MTSSQQMFTPLPEPSGRDDDIADYVRWAGQFSAEFPVMLANHLPMVLFAMHSMGASSERLRGFCDIYRETNGLVPLGPEIATVTRTNFRHGLGDRSREADYRRFFREQVRLHGSHAVAKEFLPQLLPGIASSALHAFMRLAYAHLRNDDEEIAISLGYWSSSYLELGRPGSSLPTTDNPLELLLFMYGPEAFRHVKPESDLLWHNMKAVAAVQEFAPVAGMLEIKPDTLERMAGVSLSLFASTMDFCALHAVTGCHWLRLISPLSSQPEAALRYFWQAISSLVPKIGYPELLSTEDLESLRRQKAPEWSEILAVAIASNDEHDLSYTFSAHEEEKHYKDPLYRVTAARRLDLL